jgi:hypothetical protein
MGVELLSILSIARLLRAAPSHLGHRKERNL